MADSRTVAKVGAVVAISGLAIGLIGIELDDCAPACEGERGLPPAMIFTGVVAVLSGGPALGVGLLGMAFHALQDSSAPMTPPLPPPPPPRPPDLAGDLDELYDRAVAAARRNDCSTVRVTIERIQRIDRAYYDAQLAAHIDVQRCLDAP